MTPRKQRALAICVILIGVLSAVALVLYALRGNINLFYTPSQVFKGEAPHHYHFRVGGMVVKGSVHYSEDHAIVKFELSDTVKQIPVLYRGLLPDLFREGQGIVAQGQLNNHGIFIASQVLAKHDANYMPPEVTTAIQQAQGSRDAA